MKVMGSVYRHTQSCSSPTVVTKAGQTWSLLIHQAKRLRSLLVCLCQSFSHHISAITGATWIKAGRDSSTHVQDIRVALYPPLIAVRKWRRINWPNNFLRDEPRAITAWHPPAPLPSPAQRWATPAAQKPKPPGGKQEGMETGEEQVQLFPKTLRTPRAMGKKSTSGSVNLKQISTAGKPDN